MSYIRSQGLIEDGQKILLGVSGGIDSVVMAHLFQESGYSYDIAHCNFQLRGEESEKDKKFVKSLSKSLGVSCHVKKFDTAKYAKEQGLSIQMAARDLRYNWFSELIENEGYDELALAHHKEDQLETIIFNLTKGTGISGLTGMLPKNDRIIRPLLFSDRRMIENFANSMGLKWREDSSNESLKYMRNLIRHKITPVLKEINPGLLETLDFTLLRLIETETALNASLLTFIKDSVRKDGEDIYIQKSALLSSVFPTQALYAVARPFGFNYNQCVNIIESLDKVGKVFFAGNSVMNIDRSELLLSQIEDEDFHSFVFEIHAGDKIAELSHGRLKVTEMLNDDVKLIVSSDVAFLDYNKLRFPLRVRHWAEGDWFIPLGMKGKKKVSDLMIDEKIPLNLKNRVLVIECAGDIIWVIGHRIDDRYKITPETTRVWKAEYEEN